MQMKFLILLLITSYWRKNDLNKDELKSILHKVHLRWVGWFHFIGKSKVALAASLLKSNKGVTLTLSNP